MSPSALAGALTKIVGDLYELIRPFDIVADLAGKSKGKPFESFLSGLDGIRKWVKNCVVSESDLDNRRKMVGFMICIGEVNGFSQLCSRILTVSVRTA